MTKVELRLTLTILMYAGVVLFLLPFLLDRTAHAGWIQIAGVAGAVLFGLVRCYWGEEDCWWHVRP